MQKKEVNGSLIVSFFRGPADDPKKYVLAIRNQTLLIQVRIYATFQKLNIPTTHLVIEF